MWIFMLLFSKNIYCSTFKELDSSVKLPNYVVAVFSWNILLRKINQIIITCLHHIKQIVLYNYQSAYSTESGEH